MGDFLFKSALVLVGSAILIPFGVAMASGTSKEEEFRGCGCPDCQGSCQYYDDDDEYYDEDQDY